VLRNRDVPGVVGKLGTILGEGAINIAEIHLARHDGETDAMAVLRLDQAPSETVLARLRAQPEVREVRLADLGAGG
jgi:D-3-phosphoglycerate dehydrogenase